MSITVDVGLKDSNVWIMKLGKVMYFDVLLGKPVVVFNSLKSAYDVLEQRASNSSRRPRLVVANEILYGGLGLALMDHGEA